MTAIDLFIARSISEEGERNVPYDDATGLPVKAPRGNLSWGRGFDLVQIGSTELYDVIQRYLIGLYESRLLACAWYQGLDPVRQSVILDIAYNAGLSGLLHYVHMIAALSAHDWTAAATQCTTTNPALKGRYEALSRILVTGDP